MAKHSVSELAHPAVYRRAQDPGRSAGGVTPRLTPGAALVTALILSLGLWVVIWLAAALLAGALFAG